ncbi:PilZ domain-containing protein [Litorivicinus lipolyticus]|uniref:PilZ domain-containing protein n=1 Tax=Litorivicinus lipolyticus TaxID=418701 RepID=UPI003B59FBFF
MLSLSIRDKQVLYATYMPFINGGGLFIPTAKPFQMGQEVVILLALMNEPEKFPVTGKVIWITPAGAQGQKAAGIGVQFVEDEGGLRDRIETHLAGMLQSDTPTHTL